MAGSGLSISQNYSARILSNRQEISLLGFRVTEANRNGEQKCSSSIAGRSCVQSAAVAIGAATLELKCSQ